MKSLLNKFGQVSRTMPIKTSEWSHFDLIYVHGNSLSLLINSIENVTIKENQAILIYPGSTFSGTSTDRKITTISVHHFSLSKKEMTELPSNLRTFLTALRPFVKFDRVEIVNADIHRLLELETAKEDESCAFMLDSLISLVIANLISNAWREQISHMAMTMMDIDEYIRKNVAQNISPVMLSKRVGLSVNYFRVLFTDFFGMTPGKYINKIKMNEAARMLGETLLPIKTIARKVGFVQPSNFHRSFVQFHKTTPRKFRKFTVHLF